MTPEQREAMRQRFLQRQEQQPGSGLAGGKRLTPEERQRLRDQIRESQGDWKGDAAQKGGPR
jgi:ribonuclease HII